MKYTYGGFEFDSMEEAVEHIDATTLDSEVIDYMEENYTMDEIYDLLSVDRQEMLKDELVAKLTEDIEEEEDEEEEEDDDDYGFNIKVNISFVSDDDDDDDDDDSGSGSSGDDYDCNMEQDMYNFISDEFEL